MSYLAMLKNPLKIPGSGSGGGRLPKFNQFFLVYSLQIYIRGINFREDPFSSFYVKLLTDKQTDNAGHYITSLADVKTSPVGQLLGPQ